MENLPSTSFIIFTNTLKTASAVIDRTTFLAITEALVCAREEFALFCIVEITKRQVIDYVIKSYDTWRAQAVSDAHSQFVVVVSHVSLHAHLVDPAVDCVSFLAPLLLSS